MASLVVGVAVATIFNPVMQYLPLVLPGAASVIGSGAGWRSWLLIEVVSLAVAFVLGAVAIGTRRGRAQGVGAIIIAVTVGAYSLQVFFRIGAGG